MTADRFAYAPNLARARGYRGWRSAFWPPADHYRLFCLDLGAVAPSADPALTRELDRLHEHIEAEWIRSTVAVPSTGPMQDAAAIAATLRRIAEVLPDRTDRRALDLRADALEHGYTDAALEELAAMEDGVTVVAGRISTWYGKEHGGRPTAFACVRDPEAQRTVTAAMARLPEAAAYVRGLHADLRIAEVPSFAATRLFFMAGEGNRHPKHIAYFLPEDEGVKRSPFKRTYYFTNTHRALIEGISLPLSGRHLDLGVRAGTVRELEPIPTLGVLAHEIGHSVRTSKTAFRDLNAADRWASVTLQEAAADVFGTLLVAEAFAPALGLEPSRVLLYHLSECLRYVDRGLGCFPDSDGMYLQLNYLASFGALTAQQGASPVLASRPDLIVAGFRSLARVLADTLLAADIDRTLALHRMYGPASVSSLEPLIAVLRAEPPKTLEYVQESTAASHADAAVAGYATPA